MFKSTVKALLDKSLEERKDLFLIDFDILEGNSIRIVIDGDNPILIEDCMHISRAIENNIDREEYDFSLEVTSAGATSPLINNRQYKKNIGRNIAIKAVNNQQFEATLAKVNNEGITLKWETKEPKPKGKGKITLQKVTKLTYSDIIEARVKINFKK